MIYNTESHSTTLLSNIGLLVMVSFWVSNQPLVCLYTFIEISVQSGIMELVAYVLKLVKETVVTISLVTNYCNSHLA